MFLAGFRVIFFHHTLQELDLDAVVCARNVRQLKFKPSEIRVIYRVRIIATPLVIEIRLDEFFMTRLFPPLIAVLMFSLKKALLGGP